MFMTHLHIIRSARKLKKEIPENYQEILENIKKFPQLNGNKIIFTWRKDGFATFLSSTAIQPRKILFNLEWAARLVLFNDAPTINAFTISVGHELTHKGKELHEKHLNRNDNKFQLWIQEIHADFGAAQTMVEGNRNKLMASITYKQALKKKDLDRNSHPSWTRRRWYIEYYDFNEKLIRKIAEDTHCNNKNLIDSAIKFYNNIILTPPPKELHDYDYFPI